ncbi:hypothetical protein [Halomicronema hongdechloris]|uniref:hypothetical protein n=1 Tax=Halomicronema hongdechloris TaxID=1209493 RepID=UPI0010CB0448|nr:hypothetical protein [Halomicronema hongdechloris]
MRRSHRLRARPPAFAAFPVRSLSWLHLLRHYVTIARSLILQGVGLGVLLPESTDVIKATYWGPPTRRGNTTPLGQ